MPVFTDGRLGPGADVVDRALGGTLAEFMAEAGFEGKRGEALAVPTSGRLGAKAAVLVGMGERDTLDADALRRAGAALARRSSKVAKVATTLLDAAPDSLDRGDAAQALVEGVALGWYQFLKYKSDGEAVEARARAGARPRQREGARRHRARRADRRGRRVGARPRERARGGEVARRDRRRSRARSRARTA